MMRTRLTAVPLLLTGFLAIAGPNQGWAQAGALTAAFAVGARARLDSLDVHSRGKFEEYRHVPTGPFLEALRVHYAPGDGFRSYTIVAREGGERDQSAWAGGREPGRWNALLRWDRIPHTFSSTARMLGQESPRGTFTLPSPRPDTAGWNRAPYLDPVRTRWDPVRASLALTPSDHWDLTAEYTWLDKSGSRPMGMAMGSPGNNFREVLEPIDQTVQSLRLSEGYTRRHLHLQFTYDFSHFSNRFPAAVADNPLVATSTATGGSAQGRSALAPTNLAHTFLLTGALVLPKRTRVTGTLSLGWRRQNQMFLPATSNSAINNPLLDQLPASLHGDVRTALLNIAASSHPLPALTLAGRFRHFSLTDHTEVIEIPAFVLNDRTLTIEDLIAVRYPYAKQNADASATWRLGALGSVIGGYTFERWERNAPVRNTRHTNEHAGRVALNLDPLDWLEVRGSLVASRRRIIGEYLAVTEDQLPTLRRFDQANRNRTRWEVQALVSPVDQLSVTGLFGGSDSKYPESEFGLQRERSTLLGGEAEWNPAKGVTLGASYTREVFKSRQRSKYREPTQINNPSYDWVSNNNDFMNTFGASVTADLAPGRLEVGGSLELARARLENLAFNPTPPTGGTAAQNASATASAWPDITQEWLPATAYAQYRLRTDWFATVRFSYDRFNKRDFRTDGLDPATGADIFLGNDYRDYNAQFLSLTISYRPRWLGVGRPAL